VAWQKERTKVIKGKRQNRQLGRGGSFGRLVSLFAEMRNIVAKVILLTITHLLICTLSKMPLYLAIS
jgi:hypothetical protein